MGVIIAANSRVEKLALLLELREKPEGLQVVLRIGEEIRAFNASARMRMPRISFGAYSLQQQIAGRPCDRTVHPDVRGSTTANGCAPRLVRGGAMT